MCKLYVYIYESANAKMIWLNIHIHVFPALIFKIRMPKTRGVIIIQAIYKLTIRNFYTGRLALFCVPWKQHVR